ncbi:MAG TPA: hypothetical protein VFW92_06960 [Candidatus Limnocylindrales bacterium]|nr:hypothetical protein [Candidatus Limnocylindrales bacterium]
MIPIVLILAGLGCLAAGLGLLRWLGPRLRVARLLAAAPPVSIDQAATLARRGPARYVRVRGRVTSNEEFPDEFDRPLVYRRRRLELRSPGAARWQTVEDEIEAVPFAVEERGAAIGVDAARLEEGLVVLSREAEGTAAEVPQRLPEGTDPRATVRHRILQVSAIEHVEVAGRPALDPDGHPTMTAGLGRPLILSTLERDEAMRVIAGGRRRRVAVAGGLMAAGLVLVAAGLALGLVGLAGASPVRAVVHSAPAPASAGLAQSASQTPGPSAASPTPASSASDSAGPSPSGSTSAGTSVAGDEGTGDTRSSGEGAGLVGEPFVALIGVLAVGLISVGAATLFARLGRRE